jgi:hypothetical protein
MTIKYEIELAVITDAYERGRAVGLSEGKVIGQSTVVQRLRRFRAERSKTFDVGGPVLDQAIQRCSATITDITPPGIEG